MIDKILDSSDIKKLWSLVEKSDNIVMTCHVRPDGDALGSTLGLYHIFAKLGKNVNVVIPDLPPKSLAFIPGFKELVAYSKYKEFGERLISEAQLIICCDFNKLSRQGELGKVVEMAKCQKVLVDHHQDPDDFADLSFSYPEMSSASELVFRIIAAMGLYVEMDKNCATAITTGIITDTRNLSVNCDAPDLYLIMMQLAKKGVDKQTIVKEALETRSLDSVRLHSYALLEKLQIFEQHHAAIVTLNKDELLRFNYERGDSEGLVNEALAIKGIRYAIFLREDPDCVKVSARSVANFPVNKLCEDLFNGGGHIQAAGGEFYGTIDECEQILLKSMSKYDKYLK